MSKHPGSLNRRRFLKYGLMSAATALSVPAFSRSARSELPQTTTPQTIIVIGAGLAGLAAAYQLTQAGHQVTILEANQRPGGRVYTLREPFEDGLYAEAGAFWIASNHDLTLKYINRFNLPLVPNTVRNVFANYYGRGQQLQLDDLAAPAFPYHLSAAEAELSFNDLFLKYFGPGLQAIGSTDLTGALDPSIAAYDQLTVTEYLRQQGASADAIALLRLGYLDIWGDGIDTYSALQLFRDLVLNTAPTYYQIQGGNDRLPQSLAQALVDRIIYQAAVTEIVQQAQQVEVTFLERGTPQTLSGDRVICTVPFSVLNQIQISPPLSAQKQQAIEQLGYTSVTRVFLQTQHKFWQERGLNGYTATDLPVGLVGDATFSQPGSGGILETLITGERARQVSAITAPERLAFIMPYLESLHPGVQSQAKVSASVSWDDEEWAQGGYVWFQPGQMSQLLPHVAQPEGRIHFAGEHTSVWNGWMQGALQSGERAAQEIHELL